MKQKEKTYVYDDDTGQVIEQKPTEYEDKKSGHEVKLNRMLLDAFTNTWMPAVDGQEADVKMRLIDLRTYFQCYTTDDARCVDMLPHYLEELSEQGYAMRTDAMGQPFIPVKRL